MEGCSTALINWSNIQRRKKIYTFAKRCFSSFTYLSGWCGVFFVALFFYLYKLYNKFLIFQEATRRNDAKEGGGRTRSVSTSFSIQTSEPYPRSSDWHYDIYYEVPPSNIMLLPGSLTSDVELSQRLQYPSGLNPKTSRPHMEVFLWRSKATAPPFSLSMLLSTCHDGRRSVTFPWHPVWIFFFKNEAWGVYVSMTPRVLTGIASADERKKRGEGVGGQRGLFLFLVVTLSAYINRWGVLQEPPGPGPEEWAPVATPTRGKSTSLMAMRSDSGRNKRTWPEHTQTEPEYSKLSLIQDLAVWIHCPLTATLGCKMLNDDPSLIQIWSGTFTGTSSPGGWCHWPEPTWTGPRVSGRVCRFENWQRWKWVVQKLSAQKTQ